MEKSTYTARDKAKLSFDTYSCDPATPAKATVVFLHGSTYNTKRYAVIAKALLKQQFDVVLLDWRGHGASEGQRGDVDYVGQLEDDLSDFIDYYRNESELPIILGGHSAGAVVCLRYTVKYGCDKIDSLAIVAPAISSPMEAIRYRAPASEWQYKVRYFRAPQPQDAAPEAALKHAPTFKASAFLWAKFLPFLRHRAILTFPANPKMAEVEGRVLGYSYNLMLSCDITDYANALNRLNVPVLLMAGESDEILHPDFIATLFHWHLPPHIDKKLVELPRVNHMSVVSAASKVLPQWLTERYPAQKDNGAQAAAQPATTKSVVTPTGAVA
jgi:non-heme chloroperoxidase